MQAGSYVKSTDAGTCCIGITFLRFHNLSNLIYVYCEGQQSDRLSHDSSALLTPNLRIHYTALHNSLAQQLTLCNSGHIAVIIHNRYQNIRHELTYTGGFSHTQMTDY